jgi:DNA primase
LAHEDSVEHALGVALRLAAEARQWTAVEVLSRELAARRLARTEPAMATLEAERAKREKR